LRLYLSGRQVLKSPAILGVLEGAQGGCPTFIRAA
jgi:hypothetical protein